MRNSEQIKAEIVEKFGFFPPFFSPAEQNPQVLENLWQQTLSAYIGNPLSPLFKEKLAAYLSRYCAIPYCMICHSCSLRPLGVKARQVLELLELPSPENLDIDAHLKILAVDRDRLRDLSELNSVLEDSLLYCAIFISQEREQADYYRSELRRLLGSVNYQHLVTFIAYVKMCHAWMEAHPEVAHAADKRSQEHLAALLGDEPGLADFFSDYWERVKRERQSWAEQQAASAERKRNEAALHQSGERLRLALEAAHMGTWDWDILTNKVTYSVNTEANFGLAPGSFDGSYTSFLKSIHPDDHEFVSKAVTQAVQEGADYDIEFRVIWPDSTVHWVASKGQVYYDKTGKAGRMAGVTMDITARKRAEEELKRQNLRSQLFAEVTLKIRQSLQLKEILQTTITEVQRILQADRVLFYRLWSDGSGSVVTEAVVPGCPSVLGETFPPEVFPEDYRQLYSQGRIRAVEDVQHADVAACLVGFLQQFGVKAKLVVPILLKEDLWGLLIVHQCTRQRQWTSFELELLQHLADQISIALAQAQLLEQEIRQRQELARSQEEMRAMSTALESAVEGISRLDAQGRYIFVNQAYASMIGYQPEELLGMEWLVSVHAEDHEKLMAAYQQMLAHGKAEVEARAVREDGSVFDKQVVMVRAYDQQQQFVGHYCFMKDISDRREIERMKDEFVSVVSHELRTPLTSIRGSLGLLASGVLHIQPKKAQRMLEIAVNNTDRLVRLINDILDIERIESGKVTMTKQACDAANLMLQSADTMRAMAEKARVSLSVSPILARLWADPDRIIQTLTNLLSNAIKFSPPDSTVWLTAEIQEEETRRQGDKEARGNYINSSPTPLLSHSPTLPQRQILFKVQDQGRGIPANKLETIFGRFQQVDASDSRRKGGTGLGLAICRSIAQHHGGRIWVESTLGEGSTFYFTLPVLPQEEAISATDPSSPAVLKCDAAIPATNISSPLVLVCDDDPGVRDVVQNMLEQQGYRVLTVASGQEAVEQAEIQQPEVILLNLMMPGMHGWETLAALKEQANTQHIPAIIFSGLLPDARTALHPGVSDWVVKPPDERSLFQALERALNRQHQNVRVLVVEDDLDLARVLIATFERHGIETFHAQTRREAIQLSQRLMPNLLVLDLILPEVDGFAVVDWLRHHNRLRQVPLVVYTAKDLDDSERERLKLGQTLFLTKSRITPQEFEQRVIILLNRIIRGREGGGNCDS